MRYFAILMLVPILILSCSQELKKSIAIQPYGNFDLIIVDSIKASIEKTFGFNVSTLPPKEIPQSAFVNIKSPRYRADSILQILKRTLPNEYDHILGLTIQDLSTTKRDSNGAVLKPTYKYEDWGVFGLGYCPGSSCIVSTFRLNTTDRKLLLERLKKVCNHELGHNLGLPHCTSNDKCVMKDGAETIKTVDYVNLILCNECKSKIE